METQSSRNGVLSASKMKLLLYGLSRHILLSLCLELFVARWTRTGATYLEVGRKEGILISEVRDITPRSLAGRGNSTPRRS